MKVIKFPPTLLSELKRCHNLSFTQPINRDWKFFQINDLEQPLRPNLFVWNLKHFLKALLSEFVCTISNTITQDLNKAWYQSYNTQSTGKLKKNYLFSPQVWLYHNDRKSNCMCNKQTNYNSKNDVLFNELGTDALAVSLQTQWSAFLMDWAEVCKLKNLSKMLLKSFYLIWIFQENISFLCLLV